jgi:predicted GIY-YIG superfamily endonuclease
MKHKPEHQSDKGRLVKGYIPPISRSFLEFETFRKDMHEMLKKNSGVYVLYKDDDLYYVGITSRDLFWRLYHHTKDKHKNRWNKFSVFIIKRGRYLKDIESMIHRISETQANLAKGKFKGHYAYDHKIKKMVRKVSDLIRDIKKGD